MKSSIDGKLFMKNQEEKKLKTYQDEVLKKSGQIYKLQNENQKLLEKRASWKIKDYLFVFCIQQDPCTLSWFSFFGDII